MTAGLSRELRKLPEHLRRSLTGDDRGIEQASHHLVSANTGLDAYFADAPPWQRGTNENTNRLLQQYFPKGTSMADLTHGDLDIIAGKRNARPRKTLEFDTPAARFTSLLR